MRIAATCRLTVGALICAGWVVAGDLQGSGQIRFENVAAEAGVVFSHMNQPTADKHLPETMGSGALLWDYDNDGWLDILLVTGGSLFGQPAPEAMANRLYRNDGDGTFTEVTERAGIVQASYGMGACAADYDNDGWTDVYLTGVGSNRLYRNDEGRFVDETETSGTDSAVWSTSCAFADIDNDGHVDLYVANYVDWSPENNKHCTNSGYRVYCHPNVYDGLSDVLFLNNGDGTFREVSDDVGLLPRDGNALGVVFADFNLDGWADIYVANDSEPNFLFENGNGARFEEVGLLTGVAVSAAGQPQAGMGVDAGDIDGDGLPEILVTNLAMETHSLYGNMGDGLFEDRTYASGVALATLPYVGFGTAFLDFDNDSDLDIAIANGDVIADAALYKEGAVQEQLNLLLENDGIGRFTDVGPDAGPGFATKMVSRALATGDFDNDGDLDILVTNNGGEAELLRNEGGNRNAALLIRLVGTDSNRSGIGARLTLSVGGRDLVRLAKAGTGYLSQSDPRVHFGLGAATGVDRLRVEWPSGAIDIVEDLAGDQLLTLVEGEGITDIRPLGGTDPASALP